MDDLTPVEVAAAVDAEFAPRTSIEKFGETVDSLSGMVPESEGAARVLQAASMLIPHVRGFLPDDPADFDQQLLVLAQHALLMRSDDAPQPTTLEQLLAGEVS